MAPVQFDSIAKSLAQLAANNHAVRLSVDILIRHLQSQACTGEEFDKWVDSEPKWEWMKGIGATLPRSAEVAELLGTLERMQVAAIQLTQSAVVAAAICGRLADRSNV